MNTITKSMNFARRTAVENYELQIATLFNAKSVYFSELFLSEEQIDQYEDVLEQALYLRQMYNLRNINTVEVRFETVENANGGAVYGIVIAKENADQHIDVINFGDKSKKAFACKNFSRRVRTSAVNKLIATHEFAHVLTDYDRNRAEAVSVAYWRELEKIWRSYSEEMLQFYEDNGHIDAAISCYSLCNIYEFHAEAFVEYHLSDEPTPVALEVGQLIDKYFKNQTN